MRVITRRRFFARCVVLPNMMRGQMVALTIGALLVGVALAAPTKKNADAVVPETLYGADDVDPTPGYEGSGGISHGVDGELSGHGDIDDASDAEPGSGEGGEGDSACRLASNQSPAVRIRRHHQQ